MVNSFGLKTSKAENIVQLKEVNLSGNVCGEFIELSIEEVYYNNGINDIEAEYIFPLPDTAVITGFEANLGGKILKAQVVDKKTSEKIYNEAISNNNPVFSLEEIDENVFKIYLGKILISEKVKIKISYIDQLMYEDGDLKLIIPAITTPKYLLDKKSEEVSIDSLENSSYKCRLNLFVEPLERIGIVSPTHSIKVEWDEGNVAKVTFKNENTFIDEDFVLLFKERERQQASGMIYEYMEGKSKKGVLYLRVRPQLDADYTPQNYDFLIDISSSMQGEKIEEAKNALQLCLRNLYEGDSFNIVAAEESLHYFSKEGKVPFNEENLKRASEWIDKLEALDDAEIFEALKYCLEEKNQSGNSTVFVFTDDEGENDEKIVNYVKENIGDNRIFTFGIDSSASSYLINKLSEVGYGKAEFIYPGERIDDMVIRQINRIRNPQVDITDIQWGNMKVQKTYPNTIDYLYDEEPFSIFASVNGEIEGKVIIKGKVGEEDYETSINLDNFDLEENANLIQKVWIKKRMESLEEKAKGERGGAADLMRETIIGLSKDSGIITSETSFIMVEIIDEPVLGIAMKKILPIKSSEETIKNITEAYFIESPSFIYRAVSKEKSTIAVYERENLLRILAKNQFADGSFADNIDDVIINKVETTAIAVLSFTLGKDDISPYSIQLLKSIKFLMKAIDENCDDLSEKAKEVALLALQASVEKGITKGVLKNRIQEMVDHLFYDKVSTIRSTTEIIFGIYRKGKEIHDKVMGEYSNCTISQIAVLSCLKVLK